MEQLLETIAVYFTNTICGDIYKEALVLQPNESGSLTTEYTCLLERFCYIFTRDRKESIVNYDRIINNLTESINDFLQTNFTTKLFINHIFIELVISQYREDYKKIDFPTAYYCVRKIFAKVMARMIKKSIMDIEKILEYQKKQNEILSYMVDWKKCYKKVFLEELKNFRELMIAKKSGINIRDIHQQKYLSNNVNQTIQKKNKKLKQTIEDLLGKIKLMKENYIMLEKKLKEKDEIIKSLQEVKIPYYDKDDNQTIEESENEEEVKDIIEDAEDKNESSEESEDENNDLADVVKKKFSEFLSSESSE